MISKKRLNQLWYTLPLMLALWVVAACSDDTEAFVSTTTESTDAVSITIDIPALQTPSTRSMTEADEAAVSSIYVLAFKSNGDFIETVKGEEITNLETTGSPYQAHFLAPLSASSEVNSLMFVANVDEATVTIATASGTTKATIIAALMYNNSVKWGTSGYTAIPMYAEKTGLSGITKGMKITDVALTRMLARIDVTNEAYNDFTLQNVYLVNYNTAGYIAPEWDNDGNLTGNIQTNIPASPNPKLGESDALVYDFTTLAASSTYSMLGEIYTFESAAASGGESDDSRINATCLIFEGEYEGKTYFYRVDFTEGTDANGKAPGQTGFDPYSVSYMPILRNHRYEFTITAANGIGYESFAAALKALGVMNNLKTELQVVDESGIISTVFDGQYYLGVGDDPKLSFYSGSTATVSCVTNYSGGWEIDKDVYTDGIEYTGASGWLELTGTNGEGTKNGTVTFTTLNGLSCSDSSPRTAKVHLKAGRLRHTMQITQVTSEDYLLYAGMFGGEIVEVESGVYQFSHALYVRPCDESVAAQWASAAGTTNATDEVKGKSNTLELNSSGYPASYTCFQRNTNYASISSTTDDNYIWYLPAQEQLMALWIVNFSFESACAFGSSDYWSSTEQSSDNAWFVNFGSGASNNDMSKTTKSYVRCVKELLSL